MELDAMLAHAEEILKPFTRVATHPASDRLDVTILPNDLEAAVSALVAAQWGYLTAITGLDRPGTPAVPSEKVQQEGLSDNPDAITTPDEPEGSIEILYHFCQKAAIATIRTSVRYSFAVIPTICGIIPAATLYERELGEMYGIQVVGTPNKDKLLLPDDWPDGVYPMRKSFQGLEAQEK